MGEAQQEIDVSEVTKSKENQKPSTIVHLEHTAENSDKLDVVKES